MDSTDCLDLNIDLCNIFKVHICHINFITGNMKPNNKIRDCGLRYLYIHPSPGCWVYLYIYIYYNFEPLIKRRLTQ